MRSVAAVRGLVMTVAMASAACGAVVAPPVAIGNRVVTARGIPRDARGRWWSVRYRPARPGEPVVVGRVLDQRTGEPAIGATVVLDHGGAWAGEITDEDGRFAFSSLRPGPRRLVTFFGEAEFVIDQVPLTPGWQATIEQRIDTAIAASEIAKSM